MPRETEVQRFVSGPRDLEEGLRLTLERDLAVVDGTRDTRQPEVLDGLVRRESALRMAFGAAF